MGKNTKQACLNDEDAELFEKACKKYNLPKSTLLTRIISNWLFNRKLELEDKK